MVKKILIIGASGNIGYPLYHNLSKNFYTEGTYKNNYKKKLFKFDITTDNLSDIISKNNFSDLVLSQGLINFNEISKNPKLAEDINHKYSISQLKKISKLNKQIRIIYFSSESIFDGQKGNYSEKSKPNPIFEYGKHKYLVELFIKNNFKKFLILRLSKVYSTNLDKTSLITNWFNQLKKNQDIFLANDNYLSPIHIDDLVKMVTKLIEKNSIGTFNISSNDIMNRVELFDIFFKNYKKYFSSKSKIIKMPLSQIQNKNLNIPLKTSLLNNKIKLITGIKPKTFDHYSKKFIHKISNNEL